MDGRGRSRRTNGSDCQSGGVYRNPYSQTPRRPGEPLRSQRNNDRVGPYRQGSVGSSSLSRSTGGQHELTGAFNPRPPCSRDNQGPRKGTSSSGDNNGQQWLDGTKAKRRRDKGTNNDEFLQTKPKDLGSKKGSSGQEIILTANYFQLPKLCDWRLYQYRVEFSPEEEDFAAKRRLLNEHKAVLGSFVFDGTVLFLTHLLDPMMFISQKRQDGSFVKISCRWVGDLRMGDAQYVQFYNLLLKKFLRHLQLKKIRNDYYDPVARLIIDKWRLELWPGYRAVITPCEHEHLMYAEIKFKEMRQQTCYEIYSRCYRTHRYEESSLQLTFAREILGTMVLTDYNNRFYTIDDIDWNTTPLSTFKQGDRNVTFCEYMLQKYQISIQYTNQPMLVSRTNARQKGTCQPDAVLLIPELCRLVGKSNEMRRNFKLMRDIAGYTRLSPGDRSNALRVFANRLIDHPRVQEDLQSWQMSIKPELIQVTGRVIRPTTQIKMGNGRSPLEEERSDWIRTLRSNPFHHSLDLKNWIIVYPRSLENEVADFKNRLVRCAKSMNFTISNNPERCHFQEDQPDSHIRALAHFLDRQEYQMILYVALNNRADCYSNLKKYCYSDRGVRSQVITRSVMAKPGMSVATKVAIQMACKIGAIPWTMENPLKESMVVGFDVYHKRFQDSYGALVSSVDETLGRYFSVVMMHERGVDLSSNIVSNILKALKAWETQNKRKPKHILFYRDGVGDGDIEYVLQIEVDRLNSALKSYYGDQLPALVFVIVSKRIKTRFFAGTRNPPPGTVVDDVVTNPNRHDFFLVSQSVREGTVTPISYNVIYNTSNLSPDQLQLLTYNYCHMYYNWTGPVRVPAPCQYAHKLAYLVGESIQKPINEALETTLYYL